MIIESKYRGKTKGNDWTYGSLTMVYGECAIVNYLGSLGVRMDTVGEYSGYNTPTNELYTGDVVEIVNDAGETIRAVLEFGSSVRDLQGWECEIMGFYFKVLSTGKHTFPIVNNYAGKRDLDMFVLIGNVVDNPELIEVVEEIKLEPANYYHNDITVKGEFDGIKFETSGREFGIIDNNSSSDEVFVYWGLPRQQTSYKRWLVRKYFIDKVWVQII